MARLVGLIAAATIAFGVGGGTFGQEKVEPPPKGRGSLPAYYSKLGLSDEQKEKIHTVRAKYQAQIDDLKRQIRELTKKETAETEEILTPAQKERLAELIKAKLPAISPAKEKKPQDK